jgi:HrpA-like RNA helicase
MAEIRKAHELLAAASRFRLPQAAAWLLPLHSSVSADQQRRVFQVTLGFR